VSWTFRAEKHEGLSQMPQEGEVPNMRVFSGFAILLTVALVSLGIYVLCDSTARRSAAASDAVIAGAVLFSLALTLLYFLPRPALK
jgi:uncharacterized membrane protein YgdD (TMEM256/DUF423 family)